MNVGVIFLLICVVLGANKVFAKEGCSINPIQESISPIVVYSGNIEFIYPKAYKKSLEFSKGESLDLICSGGSVKYSSRTKKTFVTATCVEEENFNIEGEKVKWSEISCTKPPVSTAKYNGLRCGNGKGKEIEVGFEAGDARFLTVYILCYNPTIQESLYSYHNITLDIQEETSSKRPTWHQVNEFYTIGQATTYYFRKKQKATINSLLGLDEDSNKYIQNSGNYYLARGHMTAKADNFYPSEQNASFMMMNVAPQWQTFNSQNWEYIEVSVRKYAERKGIDVQVYTGVYGVATLPHASTGKETELWLYVDHNENKALPVPEIYWKVVYDEKNEEGVVLIGINNPYLSDYEVLCKDVSQDLDWLTWHRNDQKKGFCYACDVNDFRKVVDFVPELNIKGLLV